MAVPLETSENTPWATVPRNGGQQPKDWRAPTQGLAGVTFQHCRRPRVLPRLRRMRVRGSTWKFSFGLGAWYVCIERRWLVVSRHLVFSRRLVFSTQGGAGKPNCHVFFRFSMGSFHGVPVTVLPSSIFFNLTEQRNFRSCYPQFRWTAHQAVSGPVQGLGDNAQSHMNGKAFLRSTSPYFSMVEW